ncbi:hypothetical protein [Streptomyces sp. NPDC051554]|uniref:hypothetical protein n=1 Tax=Streptomyces sp. NPDC051554 TaxID=3365656 RepID=UPI0037BA669A
MRCLTRQFRQRGRTGGIVATVVDDIVMDIWAGKPTTLPRPTVGRALTSGYDLRTALREIRRIGHVAQRCVTSPEVTVSEEPRLQARLYGMGRWRGRTPAVEVAERFDLTGLDYRQCGTLPGGQRRQLDMALGPIRDREADLLADRSCHSSFSMNIRGRTTNTTIRNSRTIGNSSDGIKSRCSPRRGRHPNRRQSPRLQHSWKFTGPKNSGRREFSS